MRKKEVRQRIRSTDVTDVTDFRKKQVRQRIRSTDVTDFRKKEEGRRKEEEARKARVSAIQNLRKTSICRTPCTSHLTALVGGSFMRTLVLSTNRDSLSRYDRPDRTLRLFDRYFYDKLGSVAECRHAAKFATVFLDNFVGN